MTYTGPNYTQVTALLEALTAASEEQWSTLARFKRNGDDWDRGWSAVRDAVSRTSRLGQWHAARSAAFRIAWRTSKASRQSAARQAVRQLAWDTLDREAWMAWADAADSQGIATAATDAALRSYRQTVSDIAHHTAGALVVIDLVGQYGLEQHHIDTLLAPVVEVFGTEWLEAGEPRLTVVVADLIKMFNIASINRHIDLSIARQAIIDAGENAWENAWQAVKAVRDTHAAAERAYYGVKLACSGQSRRKDIDSGKETPGAGLAAFLACAMAPYGLEQQHIDVLLTPWRAVFGKVTDLERGD